MDMETARLAAEIIGLTGVIGGCAFAIIRTFRELKDGIKCLLRANMMNTYYRNHEKDELRDFEMENFTLEYAAYKALGGNSFVDKIHDDVQKWEVIR